MHTKKYIKFISFLQILLGMLFIYAAIDKIIYPAKFAEVIYHYKLLPLELLNICAIIIPWIEIGIGILLVFDIWVDVGSFFLMALTFVFIILIFSAMMRGLNIECGCFSLNSQNSYVGWKRIVEDIFMIIGGSLIFQFQISQKKWNNF